MREKMSKQHPPAPTASAVGPSPLLSNLVGYPGTEVYPATSHHPTTPVPHEPQRNVSIAAVLGAVRPSNTRYALTYWIYLRNEFHFSEVYRSVNYIGSRAKGLNPEVQYMVCPCTLDLFKE